MTVLWAFPGQGAQRAGMGADVFDRYPELVREADAILGYSIRAVCLDGAEPGLDDTRSVQPALYAVSALSYLERRERGAGPDFLAGHSLGEYAALFAAGCFDFGTGLRLVRRRGELMGAADGGGMVAVVGADPDRLAALLAAEGLGGVDVANRNSAAQIVLAGPRDELDRAVAAVRAARIGRCALLRVSAAFHSRYMRPVAQEFEKALRAETIAAPRLPVIANVTARPYPADPDAVRELLLRQIVSPVRWWESMSGLLRQGVDELVEIGPGTVLTELWKKIREQPAPPDEHDEPSIVASESCETLKQSTGAAPRAVVRAERLGSAAFRDDYGVKYAYLSGSMFKGIASTDLVVRMARAGLLGFFGAGGLTLDEVDAALRELRTRLGSGGRFGINLLATPDDPAAEQALVELYLRHDVQYVEAAGYTQVTPGLVRLRFSGCRDGDDPSPRHVLAKVSRPEVAEAFMSPPPSAILERLVAAGSLTKAEAEAARRLPVAGDVCVECDSGGHTDAGSPFSLIPAMLRLRDRMNRDGGYVRPIRLGAAGGLGAPESVAAAFVLGADFVVTGSVNQCSAQAGTSADAKEMLAAVDVQDTAYAPAGDMFETGARVQVVRKGTLFPARANKLYQLYRSHESLDEIDAQTRASIEEKYFRRSLDEAWAETGAYLATAAPARYDRAERSPKARMASVFRWYFVHSTRVAMAGVGDERVNYQIHCGPAMGAFNRLVADTPLRDWRSRHVDGIAELLMTGAAELIDGSLRRWSLP